MNFFILALFFVLNFNLHCSTAENLYLALSLPENVNPLDNANKNNDKREIELPIIDKSNSLKKNNQKDDSFIDLKGTELPKIPSEDKLEIPPPIVDNKRDDNINKQNTQSIHPTDQIKIPKIESNISDIKEKKSLFSKLLDFIRNKVSSKKNIKNEEDSNTGIINSIMPPDLPILSKQLNDKSDDKKKDIQNSLSNTKIKLPDIDLPTKDIIILDKEKKSIKGLDNPKTILKDLTSSSIENNIFKQDDRLSYPVIPNTEKSVNKLLESQLQQDKISNKQKVFSDSKKIKNHEPYIVPFTLSTSVDKTPEINKDGNEGNKDEKTITSTMVEEIKEEAAKLAKDQKQQNIKTSYHPSDLDISRNSVHLNHEIDNHTKISDKQKEFIDKETKMLLLPNDEVVLGKLLHGEKDSNMDFDTYISKKYNHQNISLKRYKSQDIKNFIKAYYGYNKAKNVQDTISCNTALREAINAIRNNDIDTLRVLIDNYPILNKGLLEEAIERNNYYLIKFLIMRGASL